MYKWAALACFQEHWDLDAVDFAAMLESSLAKADNLLTGGMFYPASMILELAQAYPEKVRQMFAALLNETSGEIVDRMKAFSQKADELVATLRAADIAQSKTIRAFQDPRAMSVYLFFVYPEKYYLYKSTMYTEFASQIGCGVPSDRYDKVAAYFELLDVLLELLETEHNDLVAISDALLDEHLKGFDSKHHLLIQDVVYCATSYFKSEESHKSGLATGHQTNSMGDEPVHAVRYWLISPGAEASRWNEFYSDEVIGLGWDAIGSIGQYPTRGDIADALKDAYDSGTSQKNSSYALWQFCHEMSPGDIVYAKRGRKEILARGVVTGCYRFDESRANAYKNIRAVKWTHIGKWTYPIGSAPVKTLTDMTLYTDYVEAFEALFGIAAEPAALLPGQQWPSYAKADFLSEVYLPEVEYDRLLSLLSYKKNVILQGPPGVGKTFMAKRLAYSMMGRKDCNRVKIVQFHQSYSYEDFIMGYRPSADGFELRTGAFYDFCKMASDDQDNDYFFIIDEINRGNLSKIFGELFMLIESDKRDVPIQLLYANERFSVPANLYIIGMMNMADRSLAMMDFALRRRFAFYEVKPAFESEGFRAYRESLNNARLDRLVSVVEQLNDAIAEDDTLGHGFCIGHSFFCGIREASSKLLAQIVDYEMAPLLEEYWYDEPPKAVDWIARMRNAVE